MTIKASRKIIPEVLYKFREGNNDFHLRMITEQEIYLAEPSSYNDPFDCRIMSNFEGMTDADKEERNLEILRVLCGENDQLIQQYEKEWRETKNVFYDKRATIPETYNKYSSDNIVSVFSISENLKSPLLWSHYSNKHTGFAVGLNTSELIKHPDLSIIGYVQYTNNYPVINGKSTFGEFFYNQWFYKSLEWQYEKEWRICNAPPIKRKVILPQECFSEIILGCHISEENEISICDLIRKHLPKTIIKKAVIKDRSFIMSIENI